MPLVHVGPEPTASNDAIVDDDGTRRAWGLDAIGAGDSQYDGMGVRIAVLDSGIELDHAAFAWLRDEGRISCRNFTGGSPDDVRDQTGHGTHCAGTICGDDVDGARIGVARRPGRLLVGKVLGPGGGSTEVVIKGLLWAVMEKKADIVSMSLGIDFPGQVTKLVEQYKLPLPQATSMALEDYRHVLDGYRTIMEYLGVTSGALVVAATGNESNRPLYTINVSPPAAVARVVSVAAIERRASGLHVAPFSNTQPIVAAPGAHVRSAKIGGGLVSKNGTSMATPHVAGVAALWCQKLREHRDVLLPGELRDAVVSTATVASLHDSSRSSRDVGRGLVRSP
ncbi:S8 family serine peptidase [Paraliomyxa miuraensis]|uniref:S8 family serine peptidase n=1 Tax=Paraliomyxa miuraensis TaxID=376150 RepID=UPI00225500D4|nr:S8 family serine peptidase [Paraliomyxa miuraensis]MCX4240845.1 S8 family serine peptidase [Paraliomyxa miuraensis]